MWGGSPDPRGTPTSRCRGSLPIPPGRSGLLRLLGARADRREPGLRPTENYVLKFVRLKAKAYTWTPGTESYQGCGRFEYFRPVSAASCPPAPIMTPSSIIAVTSFGRTVFRKNL